jgi:hypothetical protein
VKPEFEGRATSTPQPAKPARSRVKPVWIAIGFTLLSITAAALVPWILFPSVRYDPSLAVLTLTLIAVVWYTYLTYMLATHAENTLNISRQQIDEREKRDAAQARSLRIRIASHLTSLYPTLEYWKNVKPIVEGALSPGQFKQIVSDLMAFMYESSVLAPEEQDHLSVILTNLSKLSILYEGGASEDALATCAENQRTTIEDLLKLFGKRGYLSGTVNVPWAGTGSAKGSSKFVAKGENATPERTAPA